MLSQADDLDPYNLYAVCYLDDGGNKKTFIRDHMLKRMDKNGVINFIKDYNSSHLNCCRFCQTNCLRKSQMRIKIKPLFNI
jgi:hypothetical protein